MKLLNSKGFYIEFIDNICLSSSVLIQTYDNYNQLFINSYSMLVISMIYCLLIICFV